MDANEALRLAGRLYGSLPNLPGFEELLLDISDQCEEVGPWTARNLYMRSLIQTGLMWEKLGCPDESLPLLKEALELVIHSQFILDLCLYSILTSHLTLLKDPNIPD